MSLVLGICLVVAVFLGAYAFVLYRVSQHYTRRCVGRALHALHKRGVTKRRALEIVAPEMRDEYRKWVKA